MARSCHSLAIWGLCVASPSSPRPCSDDVEGHLLLDVHTHTHTRGLRNRDAHTAAHIAVKFIVSQYMQNFWQLHQLPKCECIAVAAIEYVSVCCCCCCCYICWLIVWQSLGKFQLCYSVCKRANKHRVEQVLCAPQV